MYWIASLTVWTFRAVIWSVVITETDCGISMSGASVFVDVVEEAAT